MSRNSATRRDTGGHARSRARRRSSTGGHWSTRGDTEGHVTAPVRDLEAPTKNRIQIEVFACSIWRAGSQGGHRFSRNSAAAGPRSSGLRPSIELAHGYRTADISARARPQDREAPGFENQRRCPRRCAADAQVRGTPLRIEPYSISFASLSGATDEALACDVFFAPHRPRQSLRGSRCRASASCR